MRIHPPTRDRAVALLKKQLDPLLLVRVALLAVPLTTVVIGAKADKFFTLDPKASTFDLLLVVRADILFLVLACAPWIALPWVRTRWVRNGLIFVQHLWFPAFTTLAVVEHSFFRTTGAVGDGFLLVETLRRWGEVHKIIQSEITPLRWFGLLAPFLWSIVVMYIVTALTTRPQALKVANRGALGMMTLLGALLFGTLFLSTAGLAPELLSLRRNFATGLAADLVAMEREPTAEELGGATDVLDPVELKVVDRTPPAKNVVLILLESTSAKATSLYTDDNYDTTGDTTPFLRSLGAQGAVVDTAYSVVPHTSKALVSAHCGTYPKLDFRVEESGGGGIPTACLARLLREEGFATGFFQSAEQSYENRSELVAEMGFEHFIGKESIDGTGFDESSYFGYEDDALIKPVTTWVAAQKKPFFLGILTVTSHHPYSVPRGFAAQPFVKDERLNDYLNTVAYTDRFLSKLFAEFKRLGHDKDTLFVIVGDHGEGFGEHGHFQHDSNVYDETLRVPLVLYGAGVTPGSHVTGLRQHIDIEPTALAALGFEPTRPLLGTSLFAKDGHDRVYLHCYYKNYCRGIREGNIKYIDNFKRRGPEAYDLSTDPLEKTNLVVKGSPWEKKAKAKAKEMATITNETNRNYARQSRTRLDAFVSDQRPIIPHVLNVDFEDVTLIGYYLEPETMESGDTTYLTLYYYVKQKPAEDLLTFTHLTWGDRMINCDHSPVGGAYPVAEWQAGKYIRDRFPVRTRPRFAPGEYNLVTGFYRKESGRVLPDPLLPVTIDKKNGVVVAKLTLTQPVTNVSAFITKEAPALAKPTDILFGDSVRLLSATIDRSEVMAGIKVKTHFVWQVLGPFPKDAKVVVRLDGPTPKSYDYDPVQGDYPLKDWKPGEFISDTGEFITQEKSKTATYRVLLEVRHGKGGRNALKPEGTGLPLDKDSVVVGELSIVHH